LLGAANGLSREFNLKIEDPQGSEYVVLYLHSFAMGPWELDRFASLFSELKMNSISLQQEGHGSSQTWQELAEVTPELWRQDVELGFEVAKRLGKKVIVMGFSYGGMLALDFAARHTQAADKIISLAPAIALNYGFDSTACLAKVMISSDAFLSIAESFVGLPIGKTSKKIMAGSCSLSRMILQMRQEANQAMDQLGMGDYKNNYFAQLETMAHKIAKPTLIMASVDDELINFKGVQAFAKAAQAQFYTLRGSASHVSHQYNQKLNEKKSTGEELESFATLVEFIKN
jgi:alpha-beta hydrolase superfamily lysophospholipase